MKIILFIVCYLSFFSLQAQSDESAPSQRASAAVQVAFDNFGGFAEVYVKPNMSIWTTIGYRQFSRQLGFGEDSTGNFFNPPLETINFNNIQSLTSIRVGVRFYKETSKDGWSVWYSPVLGYSNLSDPTDLYQQSYQRADLHFLSESTGRLEAERTLELGGEFGVRWLFWRKQQTNTGLYIEGSTLVLGERSIINSLNNQGRASLELRAALGFLF